MIQKTMCSCGGERIWVVYQDGTYKYAGCPMCDWPEHWDTALEMYWMEIRKKESE